MTGMPLCAPSPSALNKPGKAQKKGPRAWEGTFSPPDVCGNICCPNAWTGGSGRKLNQHKEGFLVVNPPWSRWRLALKNHGKEEAIAGNPEPHSTPNKICFTILSVVALSEMLCHLLHDLAPSARVPYGSPTLSDRSPRQGHMSISHLRRTHNVRVLLMVQGRAQDGQEGRRSVGSWFTEPGSSGDP